MIRYNQLYQYIEITDLDPSSAMMILSCPLSWGVEVAGTEIKIPVHRFDEVIHLLNRGD